MYYQLTYDFGYLLGAILGDGGLCRRDGVTRDSLRISFDVKDKDFMDTVVSLYFKVTGLVMRYRWSESCRLYCGYMGDRTLWKQIDSYRHNTQLIMTLPIDAKRGFISGFFDAEGNVHVMNNMLRVSNTNFRLLRVFQIILSDFGIATGTYQPNTRNVRECTCQNVSPSGMVIITGVRNVKIFNSMFTSCIERKRTGISCISEHMEYHLSHNYHLGARGHTWIEFICDDVIGECTVED